MYIVADIFGGTGNTNQMAAEVGCQVPKKMKQTINNDSSKNGQMLKVS
jgi:hypothetical protein